MSRYEVFIISVLKNYDMYKINLFYTVSGVRPSLLPQIASQLHSPMHPLAWSEYGEWLTYLSTNVGICYERSLN
jgi:hypothetical protein